MTNKTPNEIHYDKHGAARITVRHVEKFDYEGDLIDGIDPTLLEPMTLSTNTEAELLPCPFCGGDAEWCKGQHGDGSPWDYLACEDCEAMGGAVGIKGTRSDMIAAWNRRSASNTGGVEVKARSDDQFQVVGNAFLGAIGRRRLSSLAAEAEPVAWGLLDANGVVVDANVMKSQFEYLNTPDRVVPLSTHPSSPVSAEVTEQVVDQVKKLEAACNQARLALAGMVSVQSALDLLDCRPLAVSALLSALNGGRENG